MEKFYLSKALLKMAVGGDAYVAYPPSPPGCTIINNKRWPQIYEICFKLKIPKAVKSRLL